MTYKIGFQFKNKRELCEYFDRNGTQIKNANNAKSRKIMSRGVKTLKLNGDEYSAVIAYNSEEQSLEIRTKSHEDSEQFWGNFTINDLDAQIGALLQNIECLYSYLCQNQEEIQIFKDRIIIRLNFLKHSKEIELQLNPMLMFSLEQHKKLSGRIKALEEENRRLRSKEEGWRKLTMNINEDTVNLNHYSISDLSKVSSYNRLKPQNLLRMCPENTLPQKGVWTFDIDPIRFHEEVFARNLEPWIEFGMKGQQGERKTVKLEGFIPEKGGNGFIKVGGLLRVSLNIDKKQLAIVKCFEPGERRVIWADFKKVDRLWLVLIVFGMTIHTDLFVDQKIVNWSSNPSKETPQQEE